VSRLFAPGWRWLLVALIAFLWLPDTRWVALGSIVPIAESWVLLAAALAVCAALGWWNGGGAWLGAAAIILAWVAAIAPLGAGSESYRSLVHGWTLLVATSFGLASLLTPGQRFLKRALGAVGLASVVAFTVAVATPDGVSSVRTVMKTEFIRRTDATVGAIQGLLDAPDMRDALKRSPGLDSTFQANQVALQKTGEEAPTTVPAFVALESLLAMMLAWVIYHRVSAIQLGPPLEELKQFRFNDQLIWGMAVGATIFFLPVFADGKDAGLNLLLFFGALYLFRGVGVLSFMTRSRWAATILIAMTVFAPLLLGALALGVGVGDTWMDWRTRVQADT